MMRPFVKQNLLRRRRRPAPQVPAASPYDCLISSSSLLFSYHPSHDDDSHFDNDLMQLPPSAFENDLERQCWHDGGGAVCHRHPKGNRGRRRHNNSSNAMMFHNLSKLHNDNIIVRTYHHLRLSSSLSSTSSCYDRATIDGGGDDDRRGRILWNPTGASNTVRNFSNHNTNNNHNINNADIKQTEQWKNNNSNGNNTISTNQEWQDDNDNANKKTKNLKSKKRNDHIKNNENNSYQRMERTPSRQQQHSRIVVVKRKNQQQQNQSQSPSLLSSKTDQTDSRNPTTITTAANNNFLNNHKNDQVDSYDTTTANHTNFGYLQKKKYYPIDDMIRDPYGHIIYIPGKKKMKKSMISNVNDDKVSPTDHKKGIIDPNRSADDVLSLPIIDVSAILDVSKYCKISSTNAATTKSGTDAARRYIRGKKFIWDVLKHHIHYYYQYKNHSHITNATADNANNNHNKNNSSNHDNNIPLLQHYILTGHGIPYQVLQNHIDMADYVLRYHNHAYSCQFQIDSYHHRRHIMNHVYDDNEPWNMTIQHKQQQSETSKDTGESSMTMKTTSSSVPWPFHHHHHRNPESNLGENDNHRTMIQYDMELYLTVMNRMASQLSPILMKPNIYRYLYPSVIMPNPTKSMIKYGNASSSSPLILPSSLSVSMWDVSFTRDCYFPSEQFRTCRTTNTHDNRNEHTTTSTRTTATGTTSSPLHDRNDVGMIVYPVVEWIPNYVKDLSNHNTKQQHDDQYHITHANHKEEESPTSSVGGYVTIRLQGYPAGAYHQQVPQQQTSYNNSEPVLDSVDRKRDPLLSGVTLCFRAYYEPRIEK